MLRIVRVLSIVSILCVGCGKRATFRGDIGFVNRSKVEIWVHSISGVPGVPPCGTLGADGAGKAVVVGTELRLPAQATITWSEGHLSYLNPDARKYQYGFPGCSDELPSVAA
jgi:hypothetical protein